MATNPEQLKEERKVGMKEGKKLAYEKIVINQLERKFKKTLSIELKKKIEESSIKNLETVLDRIFDLEDLSQAEAILK